MWALVLLASWLAQDDFKISTEVSNVVLPVTVVDSEGRFAAGLEAGNFKVFEDGRPQEIRSFSSREVPVSVGLVVDNSGSMRARRNTTNFAALHFVRLSHPEDELFVVNFNDRVSFGLPQETPFTGDVARLRAALSQEQPYGKTALYDAVLQALSHVERGKHHRKALVVVSDGGDTASRHEFEELLRRARYSPALLYTIGIFDRNEYDPNRRPELLRKLARETGGEWFEPRDANAILTAAARIAGELRTQYTIAYAPDDSKQDGGYRRVEVVAERPGGGKLRVRTRQGYYAPAARTQRSGR